MQYPIFEITYDHVMYRRRPEIMAREHNLTLAEVFEIIEDGRVSHATETWAADLRAKNGGTLAMWGRS